MIDTVRSILPNLWRSMNEHRAYRHSETICCTDQQPGAVSPPQRHFYGRRTYSGRPSSSMRFSVAIAMATSVVCRPLVRECSASPITRLRSEEHTSELQSRLHLV